LHTSTHQHFIVTLSILLRPAHHARKRHQRVTSGIRQFHFAMPWEKLYISIVVMMFAVIWKLEETNQRLRFGGLPTDIARFTNLFTYLLTYLRDKWHFLCIITATKWVLSTLRMHQNLLAGALPRLHYGSLKCSPYLLSGFKGALWQEKDKKGEEKG